MRQRLSSRLVAGLILSCTITPVFVSAETIAIIGTGQVGSALGQRFSESGHQVVYGSRNPELPRVQQLVSDSGPNASATTQERAVQGAAVVVLAVPWDVVEDVTRELGDMAGQLIIDPTNPRRIAEDGLRDYAFEGSNAERIQALVPQAQVVKALSTLGAYTMLDPATAVSPVSVPLAGDNQAAKDTVAGLITALGLIPVDVGPLRYARVIEGLHFLRYNAGQFGSRFNYHLSPDPN